MVALNDKEIELISSETDVQDNVVLEKIGSESTWKVIKSKSDTYKFFYVEFKHGRKTIRRKCIKGGTIVESNNFFSSCMNNYKKVSQC